MKPDDYLMATGLGLISGGLLYWTPTVGLVFMGIVYCLLAFAVGANRRSVS